MGLKIIHFNKQKKLQFKVKKIKYLQKITEQW